MSAQGSPGSQMPPMTGPPYLPTTKGSGGIPTVKVDVPISSVFLFLFVVGAVIHMTLFQINMRRGHKFIMSAMTFGFCMARIVAMSLRIAWAVHPHNVRLAIAANIMVYAGVLVLLIVNLIFTQRIIRAHHPTIGWSKPFSIFFTALYILVVLSLAMLITVIIQSFYTLNPRIHKIDHDIQLYGGTYFAFIAVLPIILVSLSLAIPRTKPVEKFGHGRFRVKLFVVYTASALLSIGAWYRTGTSYKTPTPARAPTPWYLSKAAFYCFNFMCEIIVVFLYILVRTDKRFHVPNGAHGPGSYNPTIFQKQNDLEAVQGTESAWPQSYLKEMQQEIPASAVPKDDGGHIPGLSSGEALTTPEAAHSHDDESELAIDDAGQWKLRPVSKGSGVGGVRDV